jgi:hypothetical protein
MIAMGLDGLCGHRYQIEGAIAFAMTDIHLLDRSAAWQGTERYDHDQCAGES